MLAAAESLLTRLVKATAICGGGGLVLAIGVTCVSIIGKLLRRGLDALFGAQAQVLSFIRPILGEEEVVQYAVGFALFTALPWVALQQGNITINVLEKYLHPIIQRLLDAAGHLIFTIVIYIIVTQQWFLIFKKTPAGQEGIFQLLLSADFAALAARLRAYNETQILGIKLWPMYTVAELCMLLLLIVNIFCLLRCLRGFQRGARQ